MADVEDGITVEILKSIREELRGMRTELRDTREELSERLDQTRQELSERLDRLHRRQVESELRIATELTSVKAELGSAGVTLVQIRDFLADRLDVRRDYASLEQRVNRLEKHTGLSPRD
jgi:ubiquinone biosynthesis protein UbiJ